MSDLWEFRSGSTENLQGKATFLVNCRSKKKEILLRITGDIGEFAQNARIPKNNLEQILKEMTKIWPKNYKTLPIFGYFIESMPDSGGDVIHIGEFESVGAAITALQSSATLYMLKYNEQQRNSPSEKDLKLGDLIDQKYLRPILKLIEEKNPRGLEFATHNLMEYTKAEQIFERETKDLVAEARRSSPNIPLLQAYCQKIISVANEDYSSAAKARDEILRIKKTNP